MSRTPMLALVVPCFNEAERLPVSELRRFLTESPHASLVLVDDGSTDGTKRMLDELAAEHPGRCQVLSQMLNLGKAEAVRAGLLRALDGDADLVGFWDADLATPLDLVPGFLEVFDTRPAVQWVIGSRVRLLGRRIDRYAWRHYTGRVFATAVALWLRVPVYDTQCGAKIFRGGPELKRILERPFLSRWIFDVELFARFIAERGRAEVDKSVVELPLESWTDVQGSKLRPSAYGRALLDFFRLVRTYRRPG